MNLRKRWFEVRILAEKTQIVDMSRGEGWWQNKQFMDRVFWVFQQPQTSRDPAMPYQVYVLEPYESLRVRDELFEQTGRQPFKSPWPALWIPQDCVKLAWTETSNAYSDHLRHRAEPIVQQKLLDEQARDKEQVDQFLKEIAEIPILNPDEQLGKPNDD